MAQTILVADDNLTMQRLASEILSQEGLEVVTVANGVAAIKKIPDLKPLVVLADADMPGKDGYEVCDFVKNQPELNHIRVLLAVSDADPYDEQRGLRAQIDEIIKKPFDREQLVSTVARCLEQVTALNRHITMDAGNAPPEMTSASQTAVPGPCDAALPGTVKDGAPVLDGAGLPEPSSFLVSQITDAPKGAGETLDAGLRGEAEPRESSRDGTPPSLADDVPSVFFDADQTSWAEPQPDTPSPTSAGESDAGGLPDGSNSARQTLSSYEVVFLENDYAGHAAPNSPAEIPEEHTTVPAKQLEAEEENAGNSAQTFASPEETQNAFPGIGSGPEEPESRIKRAPVDGVLVASIVRKVVSRMSPPALTAETVQDLEEKLTREIMIELGTTSV